MKKLLVMAVLAAGCTTTPVEPGVAFVRSIAAAQNICADLNDRKQITVVEAQKCLTVTEQAHAVYTTALKKGSSPTEAAAAAGILLDQLEAIILKGKQ